MPAFGPIRRRDLIRYLGQLGYRGPYTGKRHQYMRTPDGRRLILPNPHRGDISALLLANILRQAGISREEWEAL